MRIRNLMLASAAATALLAGIAPAFADGDGWRYRDHEWGDHEWGDHEWGGRDWREHAWRGPDWRPEPWQRAWVYAPPPPIYYAPPPAYYPAPPPVYYAPGWR